MTQPRAKTPLSAKRIEFNSQLISASSPRLGVRGILKPWDCDDRIPIGAPWDWEQRQQGKSLQHLSFAYLTSFRPKHLIDNLESNRILFAAVFKDA